MINVNLKEHELEMLLSAMHSSISAYKVELMRLRKKDEAKRGPLMIKIAVLCGRYKELEDKLDAHDNNIMPTLLEEP
jgi:hypothetical protein